MILFLTQKMSLSLRQRVQIKHLALKPTFMGNLLHFQNQKGTWNLLKLTSVQNFDNKQGVKIKTLQNDLKLIRPLKSNSLIFNKSLQRPNKFQRMLDQFSFQFLLILFFSTLISTSASAQICNSVYNDLNDKIEQGIPTTEKPEIIIPDFILNHPEELSSFQIQETKNLSPSTVKSLNKETLKKLTDYIPLRRGLRAASISLKEATALLSLIKKHPVVSPEFTDKYQPQDVEIGFCFGRAAYLHLMLLKMGLQKDSILKIWAVGEMKTLHGEHNWGFHVGTLVYVRGYGWMSIDTNSFKIEPVRHWMQTYLDRSTDGKTRIYVTEADRFSVDISHYSRVEMGLDLNRENDWYQGYFQDMLSSIRNDSLESQGLKLVDVVEDPLQDPVIQEKIKNEKKNSVFSKFKDFLGF